MKSIKRVEMIMDSPEELISKLKNLSATGEVWTAIVMPFTHKCTLDQWKNPSSIGWSNMDLFFMEGFWKNGVRHDFSKKNQIRFQNSHIGRN